MASSHRTIECVRCGGTMESGYIIDEAHGMRTVAQWVAGDPERSIWTGLKLRGKQKLGVTTYRCHRCGYLESYAGS